MATKKKAPAKKKAAKKAPAKKKAVAKKVVAKKDAPKKKVAAKKAAPKKKAVAKKKAAPKKKAVAKKAAPKKKVAVKKAAPKPKKKATGPIKEKMTKSQILLDIAESTDLTRKQVSEVIDALEGLMSRSISKKGVGEFTVPGLMKVTTVKKPAVKARKGINPFTKEETMFKAKKASIAVKVRPLKKLKDYAL